MSTVTTTNITHASNSGTANMVLASDGTISIAKNPRRVLEQLFCPCDGSTITTSNGDITIVDKDDNQALTTSYADVLGSTIAYNPPTGTTQVIYEYQFNGMRNGDDALPIGHFKFFIDSDEVTDARTNFAGQYTEMNMLFKWAINIGGSAVTAMTAVVTAVTTTAVSGIGILISITGIFKVGCTGSSVVSSASTSSGGSKSAGGTIIGL